MEIYKKIRSAIKPVEISMNDYYVIICENIREVKVKHEEEISIEYEYNMIQYTKDEYIIVVSNQNKKLSEQIMDTQMALCNVYEKTGV